MLNNNQNSKKLRYGVFKSRKHLQEKQKVEVKIFKPKKEIRQEFKNSDSQNLKHRFSLQTFIQNKLPSFWPKNPYSKGPSVEFLKKLRYFFLKIQFNKKLNTFLAKIIIVGSVFLLLYLSFFDTFFLVKSYEIEFGPNSYLSSRELEKLVSSFSQKPFMGIIPNNQYWFLNNRILTEKAKSEIPEVYLVEIQERLWPNSVRLKVHTQPILLTLAITENNQKKYYRISPQGRVLTQDNSGIMEKVVIVDRPVAYSEAGVNFQNYRLQDDQVQLNRLWFIVTLWEVFSGGSLPMNLNIQTTRLPSMTDTEVIITTQNNTKLLFDSNVNIIPKENQLSRIKSVLSSNVLDLENQGALAYIDFRIPNKRVYYCYKNSPCDNF